MSEPKRYSDLDVWKALHFGENDSGWVKWEENARLKAEVERLEANTTKLCIHGDAEIARLKAEVERLTKAGDAFISVGVKMREMIGDHHWTLEFDRVRTDWYFAAKEGKQP